MNILQRLIDALCGKNGDSLPTRRIPKRGAFTLLQLIAVVALVLLAACLMQSRAEDTQGQPQTFLATTNLPATVATATRTACTNYIPIRVGRGVSLQSAFNVSSGTSNVVYEIYSTNDGTNFTTVPWAVWIVNANGTTLQRVGTNWTAAQLTGIAALSIGSATNQNAGTLTNSPIVINRPNS